MLEWGCGNPLLYRLFLTEALAFAKMGFKIGTLK